MPGHIIVHGDDALTLRVTEELASAGARIITLSAPGDLADADVGQAAAVVCAGSDDAVNLEIALLARTLDPHVRVVANLSNAVLRDAVASGNGPGAVLDVAELAAPSVVEACLGRTTHSIPVAGNEFVVSGAHAPSAGTLRELYGDLAPVALVPADGGPVEITPGRDLPVRAGDGVVLLGTPADLARAHLVDGDPAPAPGGGGVALEGRGPGRHGRRPTPPVDDVPAEVFVGARAPRPARADTGPGHLRHVVAGVERRARLAIGALAVLAVASVTVLYLGYREPDGRRMSVLDALYFTVETIGTVGYGDFSFREQAWPLRVWAILLMVVGATLATVFFALLTNALIGRRIEETLGRRRLTGLRDHVVVVGAGSVGVAVARRLRELDVPVVVLERDPDNRFLPELRAAGVPVEAADATSADVYDDLRLRRARAVAVLTSDDLVNIETGLAVRDLLGERWSEVPVVLRVFDRGLADTVAGTFGFRHVRSPAALAAPWFVGAALGLDVVGTFSVGPHPLLVARLQVAGGDALDGVAMRELGARLRVVSITHADGEVLASPRRDARFVAGDRSVVIGPYEELLLLLRREAGPP